MLVVKPNEVADAPKPVFGEVLSPLSRAIEFCLPLTAMLRESPEDGEEELAKLVEVARQDIETSIMAGADGIYYRLRGAEPDHTTPMEYGGFYLERDRELLAPISATHKVVISVEGGDEVYLDALEDLPGEIVRDGEAIDPRRSA